VYIIKALGQWSSECYNKYIRARILACANMSKWESAIKLVDGLEKVASPSNSD
jgi:hypothetical protein